MGNRGKSQEDSLGFCLFRLNRAMFSSLTKKIGRYGVTGAEWTIMVQLSRSASTLVALAEYMQIDRAAVSRFLTQLERKGLIVRKPHPQDRRSAVVSLTPRGRKLLSKLTSSAMSINQAFLARLSAEDGQTLMRILRALVDSLPTQLYSVEDCR